MKGLSGIEAMMRDMGRQAFREMLVSALCPIFATSEQRSKAQALVDAMDDEEIDRRRAAWVEESSKFCPECGHRYDPMTAPMAEPCEFS